MQKATTQPVGPAALPAFFRDVEIISPAHLELDKYRKAHAKLSIANTPQNCQVAVNSSPILLVNRTVRDAYQRNDFAKIKQIEEAAQKDLQAVYNNLATKGGAAWTKVRSEGKEFYMSWSEAGSVWAYTQSTSANGTTQQAVVQIGTYTQSGEIVGIHSYNLTLPTVVTEAAIAYMVAYAVSKLIADGLTYAFLRFAMYLAEAAAELGFESFSFTIPASLLPWVASSLVFAIVFIGLAYLWDWLNRKYTIRLQVFNWDGKNSWSADGQALSNAKVPDGNQNLAFVLPKMSVPGDVVLPPGFHPIEVLDAVCYYAVVIWENDNTFMEGCSMAVRMRKNATSEGFMWAFDCPRFKENKQAGDDGTKDPGAYLSSGNWHENPTGFQIDCTTERIPVCFAVDALSGASDGLYNVNVHINRRKTTALIKLNYIRDGKCTSTSLNVDLASTLLELKQRLKESIAADGHAQNASEVKVWGDGAELRPDTRTLADLGMRDGDSISVDFPGGDTAFG